jgi:hypothetical protein
VPRQRTQLIRSSLRKILVATEMCFSSTLHRLPILAIVPAVPVDPTEAITRPGRADDLRSQALLSPPFNYDKTSRTCNMVVAHSSKPNFRRSHSVALYRLHECADLHFSLQQEFICSQHNRVILDGDIMLSSIHHGTRDSSRLGIYRCCFSSSCAPLSPGEVGSLLPVGDSLTV